MNTARMRTGANDVTFVPAPHTIAPQGKTHLSIPDALKRCTVAARKELRGEKWAGSFQSECAGDILTQVIAAYLAEHGSLVTLCRRGYCATVARKLVTLDVEGHSTVTVPLCYRHAADAVGIMHTVAMPEAEGLPAEALPMYRLVGMASNWRRGYERRMERDRRATADAVTFSLPADQTAEAPGTPEAARTRAVDMLADLGMNRLGKLYPVAYRAAREVAGLTDKEIADELGMKRATLASHIERSAGKVPSTAVYSWRAHAEALYVDEYRESGKRPSGLDAKVNGNDPRDWRDRQPTQNGLTITYGPATRDAWDGNTTSWWAKTLTPAQAGGLAYSARMQRTRKEGADALLLNEKRAANGLPPMS